jgi:lysophospholipase L1-like esterase
MVFAFGVNDAAEEEGAGVRVPLEESVENARAILSAARTRKPTLWIGPAPVDESRQPIRPGPGVAYHFDNERTKALNRAYSQLADTLSVPYLDLFAPLSASPAWKQALAAGDGVHPVAAGYAVIADRVRAWQPWREWFLI